MDKYLATQIQCQQMYCYTLLTPLTHDYIFNNCTPNISDQHTYFGVSIHKSLPWLPHISDIVTKASRTLNFIKRNLSRGLGQVKESIYLTMVRLQLEYASDDWHPHHVGGVMELEKVQIKNSPLRVE